MLQLIYGAAGTGKSEVIYQEICQKASQNNKKLMLIVPEQFSFETERKLLNTLGGHGFSHVEVYSFTRLCHHVFELYGGNTKRYADATAKILLMDLALCEVSDTFEHYRRVSHSRQFITSALHTVEELKVNGVTPELYSDAVRRLDAEAGADKLKEISSIFSVYQGILECSYEDALDDFSKALELVKEHRFFQEYEVYIDEFKGFTKPEFDLIEQILIQSFGCTVALCMDLLEQNEPLFSSVKETADRLTSIAVRRQIPVKRPLFLEQNRRFSSKTLQHLERNALRRKSEPFEGVAEGLQIYLAENEYDEINFALSGILKLVREQGMRYRDIVLMTRDLPAYQNILESAFEKYGIPYFIDSRFEVENLPPVRYFVNLLEVAVSWLQTDAVLSLLKSALVPYSLEEISELENYVYLWDINGIKWRSPFTANPQGFKGDLTDDDKRLLERLNSMRCFLIDPISDFIEETRHAAVKHVCYSFYHLLEQLRVPEMLKKQVQELRRSEESSYMADDMLRAWETLMEILDTMVTVAGDIRVDLNRFAELFTLAMQNSELADRPQTLDCVFVGSPDRMRTDSPKALFLVGVNDGVFPYIPVDSGLLKDEERSLLHNLGLDLQGDYRKKLLEERFVAYKAMAVPQHILVLTARRADIAGEIKQPSELISQLTSMFGKEILCDEGSLPPLYLCPTKETAFNRLAVCYTQKNEFTKTLYTYFAEDPDYAAQLNRLESALGPHVFRLQNEAVARRLFGKQVHLTPSRMESYYRCHFSYFCRYGLKVLPRLRAELNPMERGMAIHDLLYRFVLEYGEKMFELTEEDIKKIVSRFLDEYIFSIMGGTEDKSKRFLAAYYRLRGTMCNIVLRLIAEFKQSEFRPSDFELEIDSSKDLKPVRFKAVDGTEVMIHGTIDRVDICKINGQKYVRVVDYKSGTKKFKLSDVYYGLNLQMILYLFTIWKNGKGKYANVLPAGVLYMPAGETSLSLGREAGEQEMQKHLLSQYKMNGFVLEDPDVVQAMEPDMKGVFIPVEQNKDGSFSKRSSLLRLEELGKLERYVNHLVLRMAEELYHGNIAAQPFYSSGSRLPCEYCEYASVCGQRKNAAAFKPVDELKRDVFFKRIEEETDARA